MLMGYIYLSLAVVTVMIVVFLLFDGLRRSETARLAEQRRTDLKRRADGAIPLRRERMR